jgi:hypothetical protein
LCLFIQVYCPYGALGYERPLNGCGMVGKIFGGKKKKKKNYR